MKKIAFMLSSVAVACGALAQTPSGQTPWINGISMYGVADVTAESVYSNTQSAGTPTIERRTRVSSNNSLIGIKGERALFDGKGIFQLEYGVVYDGQGNGTSTGSSNSPLSVRDSFVGFSHNQYGMIQAGVLSMPLRQISGLLNYNPGSTSISDNIPLMASVNGVNTGFHTRANNSLLYTSPLIADAFKIQYGYGATEGLVSGPGTYNTSGCSSNYPCKPTVSSIGVSWLPADLPVQIHFANEKRRDMASSAVGSVTDVAAQNPNKNDGTDTRLVARVDFGDGLKGLVGTDRIKLNAMYGNGSGASGSITRSANTLGVSKMLHKHEFIAYYTKAGNLSCDGAASSTAGGTSVCSSANVNDTGANQKSFVWHYWYDEQTMLQAYVTKISNGASGSYDLDVNPTLNTAFTAGTQRGGSPTGVGVGVRFTF